MHGLQCLSTVLIFCTSGLVLACPQSLADAARKEAERRKMLERQGIEGKIISHDAEKQRGEDNRSEAALTVPKGKNLGQAPSSRNLRGLESLRATLQKLSRDIQHGEERLRLLRSRVESERWQIPKVGRVSRGGNSSSSADRLRIQVEDLEAKLRHWKRTRSELYESGRKAGFLPGELDGKGIVP